MASEATSIEDNAKAEEAETSEKAGKAEGTSKVVRVPVSGLVWGAAVVVSVALLLALGYIWWWPAQQSTDEAKQAVVGAANDGVAAVYTYSAETIDRDISSAQSHLTGDFLNEYKQYVESPAPTDAKNNAVKTAAKVTGSALMDLNANSANVLVFINQMTTSAQNPATTLASRSVIVTLTKVEGKWLISSMKPA
jgi:Mce-associated membrane protein